MVGDATAADAAQQRRKDLKSQAKELAKSLFDSMGPADARSVAVEGKRSAKSALRAKLFAAPLDERKAGRSITDKQVYEECAEPIEAALRRAFPPPTPGGPEEATLGVGVDGGFTVVSILHCSSKRHVKALFNTVDDGSLRVDGHGAVHLPASPSSRWLRAVLDVVRRFARVVKAVQDGGGRPYVALDGASHPAKRFTYTARRSTRSDTQDRVMAVARSTAFQVLLMHLVRQLLSSGCPVVYSKP